MGIKMGNFPGKVQFSHFPTFPPPKGEGKGKGKGNGNSLGNGKSGKSACRPSTVSRWADIMEETLRPYPDGLSADQVVVLSGFGCSTVKKALRAAQARGGCQHRRIRTGYVLWWHRDHFAAMEDRKARQALEVKAAAARGVFCEETLKSAFEQPPVHRLVSAAEAASLRPAGPASVWGLAA